MWYKKQSLELKLMPYKSETKVEEVFTVFGHYNFCHKFLSVQVWPNCWSFLTLSLTTFLLSRYNSVYFNYDSLYAMLKSYYKAWSYKKKNYK